MSESQKPPRSLHNRTPENRLICAEQQVSWLYADLLKAQHQVERGSLRFHGFQVARLGQAIAKLAAAHAILDARINYLRK